jgi:hypothetical protein
VNCLGKGRKKMSSVFNMVGAVWDLIGTLLLVWFSAKSKGVTSSWEVAYHSSGMGQWYLTAYYLGIYFLVYGTTWILAGSAIAMQ